MYKIRVGEKEAIDLKETGGSIWEGLEGGKRRDKCFN